MHIMVANVEDARNPHRKTSVIQRCHESSDDEERGGTIPVDLEAEEAKESLDHQQRPKMKELTEGELDRVRVDSVKCAAEWNRLAMVVLVNVRVDRRDVKSAVERYVDEIVGAEAQGNNEQAVDEADLACVPEHPVCAAQSPGQRHHVRNCDHLIDEDETIVIHVELVVLQPLASDLYAICQRLPQPWKSGQSSERIEHRQNPGGKEGPLE